MEEGKKQSVRVGILVIAAVGVFVTMLMYVSRWQVEKAGFEVHVKFKFLNNLNLNAPVKISGGITMGYVKKIYQKNLETFVILYLDKELEGKIPKKPETVITIFSSSLMGQKYINLEIPASDEDDEFLKSGDTWTGIDPPSIDQMMLAFSSWFDGKSGGQVLAEIMQETNLFISNLNAIASENRQDIRISVKQARESFTTLATQLDVLMSQLTILSTNFTDISTKNKEDIQIMLQNMAQITRDMNLITQRVNAGKGSMGKFLSDDDLYTNTNEMIITAKEFFEVMKKKPWKIFYKD
ncbi:MAG: MlaD family protein [Leptospirales bacterium]